MTRLGSDCKICQVQIRNQCLVELAVPERTKAVSDKTVEGRAGLKRFFKVAVGKQIWKQYLNGYMTRLDSNCKDMLSPNEETVLGRSSEKHGI